MPVGRENTSQYAWALALVSGTLGAFAIALPRWVLPVCEFAVPSGPPMRCHETLVWSSGFAVLAVLGLTLSIAEGRFGDLRIPAGILSAAGIGLALSPLIAPVCGSPTMSCNTGTAPGLVVIGGLIALTGLSALALALKAAGEARITSGVEADAESSR